MQLKANHKTYRSHTASYVSVGDVTNDVYLVYCILHIVKLEHFIFKVLSSSNLQVYFLTESLCVLEHQLLYWSRSNFRWINQISNHSHGSENKKFWPLFVKIFLINILQYGRHFSLWESCGSQIFKANKGHHRKMQLRILFTQNFSESVTKSDRIYSARFNQKAFILKAKTWIKCKFWKHISPLLGCICLNIISLFPEITLGESVRTCVVLYTFPRTSHLDQVWLGIL